VPAQEWTPTDGPTNAPTPARRPTCRSSAAAWPRSAATSPSCSTTPRDAPCPDHHRNNPIQHEPELRFTSNGTAVANFRSLRWATAKPERAANGKGKGDECNDEPNF
jgi:hypothetical protein